MPMTKKDIVDLGRAGLLFDVSLEQNGSYTLEAKLPVANLPARKHSVAPHEETYSLLAFLTDLKTPGIVFNMLDLTDDKTSRLYAIPKELYDETE